MRGGSASLVAQLVKNPPGIKLGFDPWAGRIPWRRERLPTPVFWPEGHKESDTTERLSEVRGEEKREKRHHQGVGVERKGWRENRNEQRGRRK